MKVPYHLDCFLINIRISFRCMISNIVHYLSIWSDLNHLFSELFIYPVDTPKVHNFEIHNSTDDQFQPLELSLAGLVGQNLQEAHVISPNPREFPRIS